MRGSSLALLALCACGSEILRPLEVDVLGLSARAEIFVIKVVVGSGLTCDQVSRESVQSVETPYVSRWVRSEGQPRRANLPTIEDEAVTILAHSEDANGATLQFVCRELSFEEIANLPSGVLELTLSRREG